MPRSFTHYWSNDTYRQARDDGDAGVESLYGNQFRRRGVQAGDLVYIVTVLQGRLFLLCKLRVERVCDEDEAAARFGCEVDDLDDAAEFVFAAASTALRFDVEVPLEWVERLRFVSQSGSLALKFKAPDRLDEQTLRGVRELTPASAQILDRFLPELEE
jgi:hypothetical protein